MIDPQSTPERDDVSAAMQIAQTPYQRPAPHVGAIRGHVAGRTDHVPMDVKAESFVIPADVVSGLGEGNTENGYKVLERMFGDNGAPEGRKDGGSVSKSVPIMAASGEFVVPPETVERIGGGDLKRGHKILRAFVTKVRKDTIKTLKKLPNPHR